MLRPQSIFVFLKILLLSSVLGAQNLVPNSSFEVYTQCPSSINQIDRAFPWDRILPGGGGTDYFDSCSISYMHVPNNCCGYENANTGYAYAGITTLINALANYRDYLQIELTDTLKKDSYYTVSFYVSLGDSFRYATNSFGCLFSKAVVTSNNVSNLPYTPQVIISDSNYFQDKIGWALVSSFYKADGGEKYLTIGNFNSDLNTDSLYVGNGNSAAASWGAYYYVDDVSVIEDSTVGLKNVAKENKFNCKIYPNPSNGEFTCEFESYTAASITIYDVLGQLIYENDLQVGINKINLKDLPSGIYKYSVRLDGEDVIGQIIITK